MNGEETIRKYIRFKINEAKKQQMAEEMRLRKVIRQLLTEADISDMHPHRSTGINVLEDVLKKMITTLRTDYKRLTTSKSQRDSFRAHMIHAVKQSLMPSLVNDMYLQDTDSLLAEPTGGEVASPFDDMAAEVPEFGALEEIEIDVGEDTPPDENKKIDVDGDEQKTPAEQEKDDFGAGLDDMDETGKNMAYTTHKKVSQYILDAFDMLRDQKDKKIFVDYLVTNLKLYFDKFEGELATELSEPTTPEYEKAKTSI